LPDTIQFSTGNQIINRYAADGRKLGTEYFTRVTNLAVPLITGQVINQTYSLNVINQNGTAYIDNKEYTTLNGNPALTTINRVHNAEGYADNLLNPYGPFYYYDRKDHLGNIREVWRAAGFPPAGTVQYTQYYPSGLPWASNSIDNPSTQPYKYNGKEFVEMNGYDTYDYGARGYYPAMGRFTSVDPLAEKYYSISPYAYCAGNPNRYIDPDGRGLWDAIKKTVSTTIDQAKSEVKQAIKEVKHEVKQVTKKVTDTTKNAQTVLKNNKSEILSVAQSLQTTGQTTVYSGLVCAAAGLPVAGVGAAPGIAISSAGGVISSIGTGIEVGLEIITGDYSNNKTGKVIGDKIIDKAVDVIIPSSTPQGILLNSTTKELTKSAVENNSK